MRLKSVTIRGFHNVKDVTYTFDDSTVTYFSGPNGSGKSTALQAVQLALLGYIPGTSKSSKEALFKHANGNSMEVQVKLDDGGAEISVTRGWMRSSSTIVSSVNVSPATYKIETIVEAVKDLELPVFNFTEFTSMTANKLKDWFINFLPKHEFEIDWAKELKDALKSLYDRGENAPMLDSIVEQGADYIGTVDKKGVELVREFNTYIKNLLTFTKQDQTRIQSSIQSLIYHEDAKDVNLTIPEIETEYNKLDNLRRRLWDYNGAVQFNRSVDEKIQANCQGLYEDLASDPNHAAGMKKVGEYQQEVESHEAKLDDLETQEEAVLAELNKFYQERHPLLMSVESKKTLIDSNGVCPYTKSTCDTILKQIEQYRKEIEATEKIIADKTKEAAGFEETLHSVRAEKASVLSAIQILRAAVQRESMNILDLTRRYEMANSLAGSKTELPDVSDINMTVEEIEAKMKQLQDTKANLVANERYNALLDKLTAEKYKVELEIECYKLWEKLTGVNGLQANDSASVPFVDLGNDMTSYIKQLFGENCKAVFNISGGANSFSFGVVKGEKFIPFDLLSSGERCLFTLVLLIALTKLSKDQLQLIMVDDLFDHLDDKNVESLFTMLANIEGIQMVFAGVAKLPEVTNIHTIGV